MRKVYIAGVMRLPFASVDVGLLPTKFKEIAKRVKEIDIPRLEAESGLKIKAEYPPNEGSFAKIPAMDLVLLALEALFKNFEVHPERVDVFRLGSVIVPKADESWVHAAAKVIALKVGMKRAHTFTEDKACSSGLMAIGLAYDAIANNGAEVAVACGIDKMSGVPDRLVRFGLTNPFDGKLMAGLADKVAQEFGLTREELDDYAFESRERAKAYQGKHRFIVPIKVSDKFVVDKDEEVDAHPVTRKLLSRIPAYPQSEDENAPKCKLVTAGNSAAYADGGGAVILASKKGLKTLKPNALAEVLSFAEASGDEPKNFILKPEEAIAKCLTKVGLDWKDLGHLEVNEAFAVGNVLLMKDRGIEREKMNRRGGAIAHGHAIGGTGASLVVKQVDQMEAEKIKYAAVAVCNAVDEAAALLLKNLRA